MHQDVSPCRHPKHAIRQGRAPNRHVRQLRPTPEALTPAPHRGSKQTSHHRKPDHPGHQPYSNRSTAVQFRSRATPCDSNAFRIYRDNRAIHLAPTEIQRLILQVFPKHPCATNLRKLGCRSAYFRHCKGHPKAPHQRFALRRKLFHWVIHASAPLKRSALLCRSGRR